MIFQWVVTTLLRPEDFGGLLFVPNSGEVVQLNHIAHGLLQNAKGMDEFCVEDKHLNFWQEFEKRGIVKEVKSDGDE